MTDASKPDDSYRILLKHDGISPAFLLVAFVAGAIIVAGLVLLVGRSGTDEPE